MAKFYPKTVGQVKLKDIAEKAGVSIGSVSCVLNNRQIERRIAPQTSSKIRAAAAKLGYLPNLSARRLKKGNAKQRVIIALVTSFQAPIPLVDHFIAALYREMEKMTSSDSSSIFSTMIEMYSAGALSEVPNLLTGDDFNAAIILNTTPEDDLFLTRSHLPYPVVLVNRSIPGYAAAVEDQQAGTRAAQIFTQTKSARLAIIYSRSLTQNTQFRINNFIKTSTQELGKAPCEIIADKLSEAEGYAAMRKFLGQGKDIDGLYAVSDALAFGACRAIKERGFKIPKDIEVVGVGDYDMSAYYDPPLTCVGASHKELAERACQCLFKQVVSGASTERITITLSEMIRASTRPMRA